MRKKWNSLNWQVKCDALLYTQEIFGNIEDWKLLKRVEKHIYGNYLTTMNEDTAEKFADDIKYMMYEARDRLEDIAQKYEKAIRDGIIKKDYRRKK